MTCDCRSYNLEIGDTPEVILGRPWFMEGTDQRLNGVPVDACISHVVAHLWTRKIVTLASCCGHNKAILMPSPNLVLDSGEQAVPVHAAIAEVDDRRFSLHQWRLIEITDEPARHQEGK